MSKIFNIPLGCNFLRELARSILFCNLPCLSKIKSNNLSKILILLPTKLACYNFKKILFEENNKKTLIMPEVKVFKALEDEWITDKDEQSQVFNIFNIKESITSLDKKILLSKYISKLSIFNNYFNFQKSDALFHITRDLIKLLNIFLIEEIKFNKLKKIFDKDYAKNWKLITNSLDIIFKEWPNILFNENKIDQITRRQQLIRLELLNLQNQNIQSKNRPIIVAGTIASVISTKKFLFDILKFSQSSIILFGLDIYMDNNTWTKISFTHPQNNFKNFLEFINIKRDKIKLLPHLHIKENKLLTLKQQILSEMMRPNEMSYMWYNLPHIINKKMLIDLLSNNIKLIEADNIYQEAISIALIIRKSIEDKRKLSLITPNKKLIRRVKNELKRWNIYVNDFTSLPLNNTLSVKLLKYIINVQLYQFSPLSLLNLLKHSYFSINFIENIDDNSIKNAINVIEIVLLRGVCVAKGIDELVDLLDLKFNNNFNSNNKYRYKIINNFKKKDWQLARKLLQKLKKIFEKLNFKKSDNFAKIFYQNLKITEQLSIIDKSGNSIIWSSNEGSVLFQFKNEILQSKKNFEIVDLNEYKILLDNLISNYEIYSNELLHNDLEILNITESRFVDLDIVILASLNENIWPKIPSVNSWISNEMMAKIGIPSLEYKIGLSAYNFITAFHANKIYLTRSKNDNIPTIPSRWLLRLKVILNIIQAENILQSKLPWLDWAKNIDYPIKINPISKPRPKPPIEARPNQMSITDIQNWIYDPYVIYVKKILKITPLDDLNLKISFAEKGFLFHEILHKFSQCYLGKIKLNAKQILINIGKKKFNNIKKYWPQLYVFWWPCFLRVVNWFLYIETKRRLLNPSVMTEIKGKVYFKAKYGANALQSFILTARADRIDIFKEKVEIIDYKIGCIPSIKELKIGLAPQLLLESFIFSSGGFKRCIVDTKLPIYFSYIQLTGNTPPGKIQNFKNLNNTYYVKNTVKELLKIIKDFSNCNTSYKPSESTKNLIKFEYYEHLSRKNEWILS